MDSRIVLLINLKCRRVVGDLPLSAFFFFSAILSLSEIGIARVGFVFLYVPLTLHRRVVLMGKRFPTNNQKWLGTM